MSESAATEAVEPAASNRRYLDLPAPRPDFDYPLSVTYCGECGLPLEYCEYGPTQQKARCRTWLEKALPDEFARITTNTQPAAASAAQPASASTAAADVEQAAAGSTRQKRGGKGVARKEKETAPQTAVEGEEAGAAPAASGGGKKQAQNAAATKLRVRIWTVPRGKGKFVTAVGGVNSLEKDLRVLAKALGTKMACGASVSNAETGEIVVQGDVAEKLKQFLLDKYPNALSADQIEIAESD